MSWWIWFLSGWDREELKREYPGRGEQLELEKSRTEGTGTDEEGSWVHDQIDGFQLSEMELLIGEAYPE